MGLAQEAAGADSPPVTAGMVLTLDQDRLFAESAFGKASLERARTANLAIEAENEWVEAALTAEEQDLTDRRAGLPPEEFTALASAFDAKVERIRNERMARLRDLSQLDEEDRKTFFRAIVPVLASLMAEKGAVAILDKSTVILSLNAIDVTSDAIARVDAVLRPAGPGTAAPLVAPEP